MGSEFIDIVLFDDTIVFLTDLKEVKFHILKGDHLAVGFGHLRDGRLLSVSTFFTFVGIVGFFNGSF